MRIRKYKYPVGQRSVYEPVYDHLGELLRVEVGLHDRLVHVHVQQLAICGVLLCVQNKPERVRFIRKALLWSGPWKS